MKANKGGRSGEGSSRGRETGKRKRRKTVGESSQSESVSGSEEELPPGLSEAQKRKEKAKNDMEKWQQTVLAKSVTCERQLSGAPLIDDPLIQPPMGPITMTSVKKSSAMSRPPKVPPSASVNVPPSSEIPPDIPLSSTAPPPKKKKSQKVRIEGYIKKLLCRQSDFERKLTHKIDYCVQAVEQYTSMPYIPLESNTEDTEEEENEDNEEEEDNDSE
ncbi:hypothetical protein Acr_14g0006410 [Actinidia rufa]|uniref:Uncharacterized protein n=1 Tax=Actinidia rufa TaxID=165716 RepID=A0A7J0FQL3_9ERIC|nr:hypothetical protein Acr_14g0006410 [Actinidia rufa]